MAQPSPHLRPRNGDPQPTTAVELLFDLVYAFAVTQISHLIIARLNVTGVLHAALLLWVVWWAWIYTTWMVNWFDPGSPPVRLIVVLAALTSLLMAAAIPTAYTHNALLFAGAYVVLQVGRNAAGVWLVSRDHALRVVLERILAWSLVSAAFWIAGALASSSLRLPMWGLALVIDLAAPIAGYWTPGRHRSSTTDYPVDGGHFAERFQSFVIIVLGESIVVTGAAASGRGLTTSSVFALAVAFLITGGLWWLYFGVVAENSRRRLATAEDPAVLARDAYTYLHLPLVAAIIMVAVGDDLLVGDATSPLSTVGLIMLVGGPALFLVSENLFRLRMIGSIGAKRVVAVVALGVAGVVMGAAPALAVGAVVAALLAALALWEASASLEGLRTRRGRTRSVATSDLVGWRSTFGYRARMTPDPPAHASITVTSNGPYLVSGGLPLSEQALALDAEGNTWDYAEVASIETGERYALCRCGHSANKPFCDGSHARVGFDGIETASRVPFHEAAERLEGPTVELHDNRPLCAFARICDGHGRIWNSVHETDRAEVRSVVEHQATYCPSGRLVAVDRASGSELELELAASIVLLEDPQEDASGPIWVRGGVRITAADGTVYETRNRVTLCRCGQSSNKPFCDGTHAHVGFRAHAREDGGAG